MSNLWRLPWRNDLLGNWSVNLWGARDAEGLMWNIKLQSCQQDGSCPHGGDCQTFEIEEDGADDYYE